MVVMTPLFHCVTNINTLQCLHGIRMRKSENWRERLLSGARAYLRPRLISRVGAFGFVVRARAMSDFLVRAAEPFCDPTCPLKRSKFNIILSCLFTLLICSWTSVHPNIPARNRWSAQTNRLKVMLWMIFAPELVLAWAVRQLCAAREIQLKFNRDRRGECVN